MRPSYTPGVGGYVVAIIVSVLVFPLVLGVVALATSDSAEVVSGGDLVTGWFALTAWTAIPAMVIGPLGAIAVHGWCRDEPQQAKHVCAAFCVGVAIPTAIAAPFALMSGLRVLGWMLVLSVPVGVSAAIGRAAVIPVVRAHREQR